jgi:hypothetical protein
MWFYSCASLFWSVKLKTIIVNHWSQPSSLDPWRKRTNTAQYPVERKGNSIGIKIWVQDQVKVSSFMSIWICQKLLGRKLKFIIIQSSHRRNTKRLWYDMGCRYTLQTKELTEGLTRLYDIREWLLLVTHGCRNELTQLFRELTQLFREF